MGRNGRVGGGVEAGGGVRTVSIEFIDHTRQVRWKNLSCTKLKTTECGIFHGLRAPFTTAV